MIGGLSLALLALAATGADAFTVGPSVASPSLQLRVNLPRPALPHLEHRPDDPTDERLYSLLLFRAPPLDTPCRPALWRASPRHSHQNKIPCRRRRLHPRCWPPKSLIYFCDGRGLVFLCPPSDCSFWAQSAAISSRGSQFVANRDLNLRSNVSLPPHPGTPRLANQNKSPKLPKPSLYERVLAGG